MSTAIADRKPLAVIQDFLGQDAVKKQLALALPKHMTPNRMVRLALSAASKNPLLLKCTPESIGLSLMAASEMGIEPDGRHGYLVPYQNRKNGTYESQFIPGYMGFIRLAYQSGMVSSFMARPVFEKDKFEYKYGTGSFLTHTPSDAEDRGALTHAWAMAELKEGGAPFVVLNRAEVMAHKKASKSAGGAYSPWATHEPEMWAKTAVRVLSKFIPLSAELSRAVSVEDELDLSDMRPAIAGESRVQRSELNDVLDAESTAGTPAALMETARLDFEQATSAEHVRGIYDGLKGPDAAVQLTPEQSDEVEALRAKHLKRLDKKQGELV